MAKKLNNYRRTVQYLQKIYNLINDEYFNGELEEITLTVQEKELNVMCMDCNEQFVIAE